MKRFYSITLALAICISFANAQSDEQVQEDVLKSKRGVPILPTKGDWAIGVDATPMLFYVGNMFNQSGNINAPDFAFTAQNPGAVYGKYRKSNRTTYRGTLLIGVTSSTDKTANAVDPDVIDKDIETALSFGLIVGLEKNREMFGRIIGNYGVQAGLSKQPYFDPVTGVEGKYRFIDGNDSDNNVKTVGGNTFSFLAGVFVGVEFFFAPRMSLGGEFAYNLSLYTQSKRIVKPATGNETTTDFGGLGVSFAPSASGSLQLLFYF